MKFTKMHGIGNDYVYVNGFEETIDNPPALAKVISDRHRGVGGDGLILILPPEEGVEADVRMRMFNADGSEAEMCGNGVRCVAKYAFDHKITSANPMQVQTGNGVLNISYSLDGEGKLHLATVNMGEPILGAKEIPTAITDAERVVNYPYEQLENFIDMDADWVKESGLEPGMTGVSMGNPHITFYVKNVAVIPLERIGAAIERHPIFPAKINVHFVQIHSEDEVTMRTFERGTGITQACGTGASAVCVSGVLTGKTGRTILAHLPGGDLTLEWRESDNHVYMTGPAEEVFSGVWND